MCVQLCLSCNWSLCVNAGCVCLFVHATSVLSHIMENYSGNYVKVENELYWKCRMLCATPVLSHVKKNRKIAMRQKNRCN